MRLADLMAGAEKAKRKGESLNDEELIGIIEAASQQSLASLVKQGVAAGAILPQPIYK